MILGQLRRTIVKRSGKLWTVTNFTIQAMVGMDTRFSFSLPYGYAVSMVDRASH